MMLSIVQYMDATMLTAASPADLTPILADAGSITLGVIVALGVIVGVIVLFTQLGALTTELSRLRGELARRQNETSRPHGETLRQPAEAPRAAEEVSQLKQALARLEVTLGQAQSDDSANKAQLLRLQEELARSQGEIQKLINAPKPATTVQTARAASSAVDVGLSDTKLVAILTAAAMACLGKRVAVRRITFINQNTVSGWAEAGRLSIHTSHNVRRN